MTPEFSRAVPLSEIGAPRNVDMVADETERRALAKRLGLVSIDRLSAMAQIGHSAAGIVARGSVSASVTHSCVASGEPVEQEIDEPFDILFVSAGSVSGEDIELSSEDCDQVEHDGQSVDLGEAAAQTLALALDPFPRAGTADAALAKAGVAKEGEEARGPFAALKDLK